MPALDLPVWGAPAQILVVFGIAEICLGWWRTLVIAYVAILAGTLYARVSLAVFLGWRYRAYVTAAAVIVAMVVEVILKDNLAGKEHLAAIVAVLVLCGVSALRHGRTTGAREGSGSGLPPIRS